MADIGVLWCKPPDALPESPAGNPDDEDVIVEVIAVEGSLKRLGHAPSRIYVEEDIAPVVEWVRAHPGGVVFNLCESFRGSNLAHMNMPALLELLGAAYTGSGPLACGLTTHKSLTKALLSGLGLPTPSGVLVPRGRPGDELAAGARLSFPLIVKPAFEDASVGIDESSVVEGPEDLAARTRHVHERYAQDAVVEQYIDGREINSAVIGNDPPTALPLSEIVFSYPEGKRKVVGYRSKWVHDSFEYRNTRGVCPAQVAPAVEARIKQLSVAACRAAGIRDYGRVDFRLDHQDRPWILEVNANPDITDGAGLARAARASGHGYDGLIRAIVEGALSRRGVLEGVRP
ncbi:MAG TPA: D-alanine--D-alanine ligase [Candidatus Polarisedimenticolia bacterium]|nr:D-alanine--D-alanine ligase [Candidatus Polarisedimenticolia bacterium]